MRVYTVESACEFSVDSVILTDNHNGIIQSRMLKEEKRNPLYHLSVKDNEKINPQLLYPSGTIVVPTGLFDHNCLHDYSKEARKVVNSTELPDELSEKIIKQYLQESVSYDSRSQEGYQRIKKELEQIEQQKEKDLRDSLGKKPTISDIINNFK